MYGSCPMNLKYLIIYVKLHLSFKIPILDEMNLMRNVQNVLGISIITKS